MDAGATLQARGPGSAWSLLYLLSSLLYLLSICEMRTVATLPTSQGVRIKCSLLCTALGAGRARGTDSAGT